MIESYEARGTAILQFGSAVQPCHSAAGYGPDELLFQAVLVHRPGIMPGGKSHWVRSFFAIRTILLTLE